MLSFRTEPTCVRVALAAAGRTSWLFKMMYANYIILRYLLYHITVYCIY